MNNTRSNRGEEDAFCTYYKVGLSRMKECRDSKSNTVFSKDHLLASTITNKEIKILWPSLDFVNCPTNSGVRNIDGITYEEVMSKILNSLIPAEISESDHKNLEEKISKSVPNSTLTAIDALAKHMETCMHGFDLEVLVSGSRPEKQEFYSDLEKNIALIIDEQGDEEAILGVNMVNLRHICSMMVAQFSSDPKSHCFSRSKESAHAAWKGFLIMLLEGISNKIIDAKFYVHVIRSGGCCFEFGMSLDVPIDIDSRFYGDMSASTTNEESDASYKIPSFVRITSQPDCLVVIVPLSNSAEEKHVIVVETKAKTTCFGPELPQDNASGEGSPETHTSETQSQPQEKRRRISSQSEESEGESEDTVGIASGELSSSGPSNMMEQLCTQHFIQLVSAMKDCSKGVARLLKSFGLYQVNHTVYITCLVPVLKDSSDIGDHNEKCRYVYNSTISGDARNKYKWRMVATDCINMLNPVHLKALLRFLCFLIYHEYQYLRT